MAVNFYEACHRHFRDAAWLERDQRHQNADHLYGLTGECGLKAILVALGIISNPAAVQDPYKVHIDRLWPEVQSVLTGQRQGRYAHRLAGANPFASWRADDRYDHDWARDSVSMEAAQRRRAVREQVLLTLQDAQADGVLP